MPVFNPKVKLSVHLFQFVLIACAMGFSVPRLFMKNQPRTRANTIALGMGAKSQIILMYQLFTEHVARFKRWHSYKANAILNCLEIVFWAAVAFLLIQANLSICTGISCTLSWIVVAIAIVVCITEVFTAVISIQEFRAYRARKQAPKGARQSDDIRLFP